MIKVERKELIFFFGYVVYLTSIILELSVWAVTENGFTTFSMLLKMVRYFAYAVMLAKLAVDQITQRNICYMVILIGLLMLSALGSSNKTFLFYSFFILAAKDINLNRILKVTLSVQTVLMVVIMSCSIVGIIPDYVFDVTTRVRHSFGFVWTTIAPIMFFFMTLEYIYLRRERFRILEALALECIHVFFFVTTNSRMCFALSTITLILFLGLGWWKEKFWHSGKISSLFLLVPATACLLSVAASYFYTGTGFYQQLNSVLSNRIWLGKNGMDLYGITLFGTPIKWIGNSIHGLKGTYNYVDCSYIQILLEYGVIALVLVLACYTYIIYRAIKNKDLYLVGIMCMTLIFSITEPRLIHMAFHPFPIMAAALLSNSQVDFWVPKENEKKFIRLFRWKRKSSLVKW